MIAISLLLIFHAQFKLLHLKWPHGDKLEFKSWLLKVDTFQSQLLNDKEAYMKFFWEKNKMVRTGLTLPFSLFFFSSHFPL